VDEGRSSEEPGRLTVLEGDPTQPGDWQQEIVNTDAIVALAGEPVIGSRWSEAVKHRLVSSRIESMRRVVEALAQCPAQQRPKVLLSASAVGFYGSVEHTSEELDETTPPGHDFLARLCVDWEAAAAAATTHGVRGVQLRIGIVLGEGGGALEKMVPAFRAFVGGPIGSGEQYVPWVHLDDVVGLLLFALEHNELQGPLNATAPQSATMRELAHALGSVLGRPAIIPVPAPLLKLLLGEAAQPLLGSQRVVPRRATEVGYRFHHPELLEALRSILS
jgi:uncharacterized protein (TIGR01777 family)